VQSKRSLSHHRDTRFLAHEISTRKRRCGAFETDWAGQRLKLRHQPNLFDSPSPGLRLQLLCTFWWSGVIGQQTNWVLATIMFIVVFSGTAMPPPSVFVCDSIYYPLQCAGGFS